MLSNIKEIFHIFIIILCCSSFFYFKKAHSDSLKTQRKEYDKPIKTPSISHNIPSLTSKEKSILQHGKNLAKQGRKALQITYGSCIPHDMIKRDFNRENPFLKLPNFQKCSLQNVLSPSYCLGNKNHIEITDNTVNFLDLRRGRKFCSDCSNFVGGILHLAGYKYETKNKLDYKVASTQYLKSMPNIPSTCLKSVQLNDPENQLNLIPGDLIVTRNPGHVVMVDSVDDYKDPFGIKDVTQEKKCKHVDIKKFKFNIIQSGVYPNKGTLRLSASVFCKYNPSGCNFYKIIAEELCKSKFSDSKKIINTDRNRRPIGVILRHDYSNSKCQTKPKNLTTKQQECLEEC